MPFIIEFCGSGPIMDDNWTQTIAVATNYDQAVVFAERWIKEPNFQADYPGGIDLKAKRVSNAKNYFREESEPLTRSNLASKMDTGWQLTREVMDYRKIKPASPQE